MMGTATAMPSIPTAPMIPIGGVDPPRIRGPTGARCPRRQSESSIFPRDRCKSASPRKPPISTPRRRCATACSTRRWARVRVRNGQAPPRFRPFDAICDHLLVIDHSLGKHGGEVVGTYRLIRRDAARRSAGFIHRPNTISPSWSIIPARSSNSAGPASTRAIAGGAPCSSCGAGSPPMYSTTRSR